MNTKTDLKQSSEDYLRIEQAILYLENHYKDQPGLEDVAANIGLSEYHFQRLVHTLGGSQPQALLQFLTKEGAKDLLDRSDNLLDTTHQVGLSSPGPASRSFRLH
jgi:AraC family transcriptional regulator of adaptative response/methylated-DNA-[protein]-cysteine methyltransferase